jgi:ATP phosphoribosyltransferase regulatory subunit
LVGRDRTLLKPLERLAQVHERLVSPGQQSVLIDLGEFRGFEYYDGIVFDVFAPGIGAELGGGGRYDHLMGRFGRTAASTGFGLDVDRLFRALDASGVVHASLMHPIPLTVPPAPNAWLPNGGNAGAGHEVALLG